MMMLTEKVSKALQSALHHLDNGFSMLDKDEKSFVDSIWHLAAELEYALFLFSLMTNAEYDISRWKPNPEIKQTNVGEIFATIRKLLGESMKAVVDNDLVEAYKCAYMARHYVLIIQEDSVKKKYKASGK